MFAVDEASTGVIIVGKPADGLHHIGVWWNGPTQSMELWVDGASVGSVAGTPPASITSASDTIGSDDFTSAGPKDIMDEVGLWTDITFVDAAARG